MSHEYKLKILGVSELPNKLDDEKEHLIATRVAVESVKKKPLNDGYNEYTYTCRVIAHIDVETEGKVMRADPTRASQKIRFAAQRYAEMNLIDSETHYQTYAKHIANNWEEVVKFIDRLNNTK